MNPEADKKVQELLVQGFSDENSLTEADKAFLRARAPYIKNRHKGRLPSVFGEEAVNKAAAEKEETDKQVQAEVEAKDTSVHPADE